MHFVWMDIFKWQIVRCLLCILVFWENAVINRSFMKGNYMKVTLKNKKRDILYNKNNSTTLLRYNGEVSFLQFSELDKLPFVRHGFSTREGGVSTGDLGTMNLSYTRGDNPDFVDENFERICKALDMDTAHLVLSNQVHETIVERVSKSDCQGEDLREKKLLGIDGLVTNEKEVILCTSYADCVPLYFVDKKNKAIGHSHSGWRGTVGKMGAETLVKMKNEFGTDPRDVIAVIGPSICQECYEVSEDVYLAFSNFVSCAKIAERQGCSLEEVQRMLEAVFVEKANRKYQLDLWMANKLILMEAGIPETQISVSCVCTGCNKDLLFSHRATNGKRGNLCGFLELV